MATPKKPMKPSDDAVASKNTLLSSFLKRKKLGRRPQAHALYSDDIAPVPVRKRKRGPEPGINKKQKEIRVNRKRGTYTYTGNASVKWKKGHNGRVIAAIATKAATAPCPSTLKPSAPRCNLSVGERLE
jgi:hypothetical protein